MWQSVLRPLLRITSKILFFCPLFWKSAFEFWKRCNTFDWGVILFDLALAQLQRWGNFLKLATMKVFHVKKAQNLLDGKCFLKLSKAYLKWKIGENGFEYIIAILAIVMCCFCFILIPTPISQCKKSSSTSLFFVLDCWFTFDKWYVDIICYPATSSKVVPTFVDDQDSRKWKKDPKNVKPLDIF